MCLSNVNIKLVFEYGYKWLIHDGLHIKGFAFYKNNILLKDKDWLCYFDDVIDVTDFENKIKSLNGQFTVIYNRRNNLFLGVDSCRNFPVFYIKRNDCIDVSDSVEMLIDTNVELLELEKEEFLSTGFVTNKFTLVEGVFQVQAGSIVHFVNGNFKEKFYYHFAKSIPYLNNISTLENIFENISQRLLNILDGKTAVIPLSGGYDSRLIACMLKALNYKNVICYSFGITTSDDVKIAKKIAKELGFKWLFVPCDEQRMKGFPDSESFEKYYLYASNYVSCFHTQDYFAVNYLNKNEKVPKDSVFIPGHSGDMLSGSHLFKGINEDNLLELLCEKHYNLSGEVEKIKTRIELGIENIRPFENFENWNLKERQAKFIINSCRIYEYFGYKYYLPLWDKELMSFFENADFEERLGQKIYIETIFKHYFIPMNVAIKKLSFHENFIKYFFKGGFRRFKRIFYKDDLNCKLTAKKILNHTSLNVIWNSRTVNINSISSAWYIKQIGKRHSR